MTNANSSAPQKTVPERAFRASSGWPMLLVVLACIAGTILWFAAAEEAWKPLGILGIFLVVLLIPGFFVVQPNQARVLVLFGDYLGSVRGNGFFWTNPFTSKKVVSLRAHNHDGGTIKVNDKLGNPIEISAVVVWRVRDTAKASFDVEDYKHYVEVQSEAALRSMATAHPYDDLESEGGEITLRGSQEEVADELQRQLTERLSAAGIEVMEARLNHLAYASEIASAMLQRQQAKAIIAARRQIVDGAVGMVELALARLDEKGTVKLDGEKKAQLVGNLLVVLCGQTSPSPVLPMGQG
jgi:regulator of protease activity HflC (stomatin/prohibitin superfamily)